MFDEILGLPAHPLIIHFAVVLTPLLAAVAVAYALLPRRRPVLSWAVVLLSLAAPVAVFTARQSGEALKAARFATADGLLGERIASHQSFATPLLLSVAGLSAAALLLVYGTTSARDTVGERFGRTATTVVSAVTVALAAVVGYYVFRAGDSGARAVWAV
ncbi:DUF2231 domain-containing protein [Nonomuraea cavernae]|uniref:DUF2231 domain-containing protein n=1 Tax=Nonomuraea cavernae TaxID=2045107 RepID=A0A917Z1M4_9ACTN|nr:DUF2231 domain-containing protein [Nonomuraea cavernae]MCA2187996.1 hypothetical protein [Nonomuraea cavernae]GGO72496.1 hypothetical protein GCM10012289_40630 [Nonomuraea cavernae]